MTRGGVLVMALFSLLMTSPLTANETFKQGMSTGKQNSGQGSSAISGFRPGEVIPGYTPSPAESGYYGGVTSPGVDLSGPGSSAMAASEAGKVITESILNTPPGNRPSLDAPFIAQGLGMKDKAETITGGGFAGCVDQAASFTEITTHQCLRDTRVEQYCTRTATITGHYENTTVQKTFTVPNNAFSYSYDGDKSVYFSFRAPATGTITSASASLHFDDKNMAYQMTWWGIDESVTAQRDKSWGIPQATGTALTEGGASPQGRILNKNCLNGNQSRCRDYARKTLGWLSSGAGAWMSVTLTMVVTEKKWVPDVVWSESCPFSKTEGAMTGSSCVEPGETRTVVVDGKAYPVWQACWKWQDTYLTQTETEGTCGEYIRDSACTVSSSTCADSVDGVCVSQQVNYSCERRKEGNGQICGGEFFCKDGSCAQAQTGISNMFGQAVSSLAAVVAAGKDVAALNGENVRAFTGKGMSCKKFAAGFNNCCKDSGWGQDIGLSSCSSDEKALGKAKDRKLTVYVGEYCSKKVLGVCLEKKRGYCVFDSKLARIVQEQGRRGQLGTGFGSGSSPDCRGITVDELQRLDFGVMDFSDFYSDLDAGSAIPEDQALLEKVQSIIKDKIEGAKP